MEFNGVLIEFYGVLGSLLKAWWFCKLLLMLPVGFNGVLAYWFGSSVTLSGFEEWSNDIFQMVLGSVSLGYCRLELGWSFLSVESLRLSGLCYLLLAGGCFRWIHGFWWLCCRVTGVFLRCSWCFGRFSPCCTGFNGVGVPFSGVFLQGRVLVIAASTCCVRVGLPC